MTDWDCGRGGHGPGGGCKSRGTELDAACGAFTHAWWWLIDHGGMTLHVVLYFSKHSQYMIVGTVQQVAGKIVLLYMNGGVVHSPHFPVYFPSSPCLMLLLASTAFTHDFTPGVHPLDPPPTQQWPNSCTCQPPRSPMWSLACIYPTCHPPYNLVDRYLIAKHLERGKGPAIGARSPA
jgi:hypothetical protein